MTPATITFNPRDTIALYSRGSYDELSESLLAVLAFLDCNTYCTLTPESSYCCNVFVDVFLTLFVREDYLISDRHAAAFIQFNPVIANVVAMTPFRNTDPQLEILRNQKANFIKILALYSPRNLVRFTTADLFGGGALPASLWYSVWYESVEGFPTRLIHENINRHQDSLDERWMIAAAGPGGSSFPYSFSTYVDPVSDRNIKRHINHCIRPRFRDVVVRNVPNRKRVAIVTARWARTSAVYKSCAGFVASLRPQYDLTLVQLYNRETDFDASLFSDIRYISAEDLSKLRLDALTSNDFMLAYFPDIGLDEAGRYLSNLRFAPIQVTGYGHPVSTWGGELDYFIAGRDVELAAKARDHYAERLVLIPGIGAIPCRPDYRPHGRSRQGERLIINCPWFAHKCAWPHLRTLRDILDRSPQPLLFRFFAGPGLYRHNALIPFTREMEEVLGVGNLEIVPQVPYAEYMARLEEGDFSIDSFPFGGYNTIIDSLWVRKPVVTLEGERFINRAASALLRQIGMAELITRSAQEYADCILRLVNDAGWRQMLRDKVGAIDLERTVFDPGYGRYFRKAIDYLIDNHVELRDEHSHNPIYID